MKDRNFNPQNQPISRYPAGSTLTSPIDFPENGAITTLPNTTHGVDLSQYSFWKLSATSSPSGHTRTPQPDLPHHQTTPDSDPAPGGNRVATGGSDHRSTIRLPDMPQDSPNRLQLCNKGDSPHFATAPWTDQWIDLIDPGRQPDPLRHLFSQWRIRRQHPMVAVPVAPGWAVSRW